ncbi:nucleotide pyrophosphatase [Marinomonas sp. 42_23_T18]|nr:nucleotide pyrophosphatase [Marinomonas sp. 42_23_T18]
MNKVILIVIDGLNYQVARDCMGFLAALVQSGQGQLYKMQCELPSLSRPLYECILTGKTPLESGVIDNNTIRLSNEQSIFHLSQNAGLKTAAAAYHWISELYNSCPYDAINHRFTFDESMPIQRGIFYHQDHYPDQHTLLDAEHLRQEYDPDFLLIHTMNVDDIGHKFAFDSQQYRNAARRMDGYLSHLLPQWLKEGYQIMITADHGMNNDHSHGGTLPEEIEVPLMVLGQGFSQQAGLAIKQTQICGLACQLLGIEGHDKHFAHDFLKV